ncbi:HAD family hydrolase [Amycolatopsis mediterranei S699]|uniref:HAD family hydrolase n=2 Tax=Amycolatopsis mediterranei TaxID=33910 RepID=A0A0H3DMQ7_AMYMU|nr:HAD family phosphatase [Amycolatopsis mediterranei]ADJ50969.1 HAD family hydrolase [Amycolatopsis mediterranei U32]AEK47984.1 HAD family hydrolase [Amycolatopsis mediterranei S699]AFO82676.1 HAD family hydrolase [Amycolatopsis mediterranei S699]AGT89805.1 HAD family hydrolase [Amycolatopsis mediterranei RB]KDO12037.1 HAD family hydrolase [Amycolatopsis mediterranei]
MDAVIFDLDGVLVDSERIWDEVRRAVVAEHGGTWRDEATRALQGMSTPEWARYLVEELGAQLTPPEIATLVVKRMAARYAEEPPLIPGAVDVVRQVSARWPVAIASSSPVILIKGFLDVTGLPVGAAVSSEQVGAGKPAPDVYLRAAELLGVAPSECAAVEDTTNGLRSALAAGMAVYAVPNPHFPPDPEVLKQATAVVEKITDLPGALGLS